MKRLTVYLVTLARKPAALDHANVYRDWQLPLVFGELRRALEQQHSSLVGIPLMAYPA